MATQSARAKAKTLSATGHKGQQGINFIEQVVLAMGSRWTPSGPNEVGIDGEIELFDPGTRRPLGINVAVQSKVDGTIVPEAPVHEYRCRREDVEYWLSLNLPVVLVVSNPQIGIGYWTSIKGHFLGWKPGDSLVVAFNRELSKFTAQAFASLANLADRNVPWTNAPHPRKEILHTNLIPVAFPERLFVGQATISRPEAIWAALNLRSAAPLRSGWVLWEKKILSFDDLGAEPWLSVCDEGTVEEFTTTEWSDSSDLDRHRTFVQLLNRTLRCQLYPDIRFWPKEDCYAFAGTRKRTAAYTSLKRTSTITVVSPYSRMSTDGREFRHLRHHAFNGQFRRLDGQWYLEIVPTYRFSSDGFTLERFHQERLSGIKRLEGNRAVLSNVLFWASHLQPTLFQEARGLLVFGAAVSLDAQVGIDDAAWSTSDTEDDSSGDSSAAQLNLPDEGTR